MQLIALAFVRTGELIGARWEEFDLEAAEWRIQRCRIHKIRNVTQRLPKDRAEQVRWLMKQAFKLDAAKGPDGHPNSPTSGHLKFPHPDGGVTMV